ncbi:hypothetical protein [Nocardiopsis oceani]
MSRFPRRAPSTSSLSAAIALAASVVLLVPGTAAAETSRVHSTSQEVIITDDGFYEVGEDVESLDAFLEENPEYVPSVEDPDGLGTLDSDSVSLTHGTLTTRTTGCSSATVTYSKTSGANLDISFTVAQLGSLNRNSPGMSIVAGQSRSFTANLTPIGSVQGRLHVEQQDETFVTSYISCS